jgi:hypothetical protein
MNTLLPNHNRKTVLHNQAIVLSVSELSRLVARFSDMFAVTVPATMEVADTSGGIYNSIGSITAPIPKYLVDTAKATGNLSALTEFLNGAVRSGAMVTQPMLPTLECLSIQAY